MCLFVQFPSSLSGVWEAVQRDSLRLPIDPLYLLHGSRLGETFKQACQRQGGHHCYFPGTRAREKKTCFAVKAMKRTPSTWRLISCCDTRRLSFYIYCLFVSAHIIELELLSRALTAVSGGSSDAPDSGSLAKSHWTESFG